MFVLEATHFEAFQDFGAECTVPMQLGNIRVAQCSSFLLLLVTGKNIRSGAHAINVESGKDACSTPPKLMHFISDLQQPGWPMIVTGASAGAAWAESRRPTHCRILSPYGAKAVKRQHLLSIMRRYSTVSRKHVAIQAFFHSLGRLLPATIRINSPRPASSHRQKSPKGFCCERLPQPRAVYDLAAGRLADTKDVNGLEP